MSLLQHKLLQAPFIRHLKTTLSQQVESFFAPGWQEATTESEITTPVQIMPLFQVELFINKAIIKRQPVQLALKTPTGIEQLTGILHYQSVKGQQLLILRQANVMRPLKTMDVLYIQLSPTTNQLANYRELA
ncbi:hypothetical protein AB3Q54_07990 [Ligilactobacillus agilis]|uniref:hypothetical protein n=1 Tax=Ligilactobacillus agilis TaxID=1601 RepID=UPI0034E23FB0